VHLQALLNAPPAVYGLGVGAIGVLVLALLLPGRERRLVRGPLVLLLIYAATRSAVDLFPSTDTVPKVLHFVAAFTWCSALLRGLYVLFSASHLTRFVKPWPKILRDIVQGVLFVAAALVSLHEVGTPHGRRRPLAARNARQPLRGPRAAEPTDRRGRRLAALRGRSRRRRPSHRSQLARHPLPHARPRPSRGAERRARSLHGAKLLAPDVEW
jgi:hypothetical protein